MTPAPKRWPSIALAALAGTIDFVAFPGIGVWPLAFVAMVPLFFALERTRDGVPLRDRDAALTGITFGFIGNLGGFYWLIEMLENFSGFPYAICVLLGALVCLYQGGMLATFAWLWFRATQRGWPRVATAAASIAAVEGVWPLLFPYYHGNHLHDVAPLVQIADLGGPMLVSALVACTNVGVYSLLRALLHREPVKRASALGAAAILLLSWVYGVWRIGDVEEDIAAAPKRTVGMVQVSMGIFEKRANPREGLRRHIEDSVALSNRVDLDLLIWPESAFTWFLPEDITNVHPFISGLPDVSLLFGGLQRRRKDGRDRSFNTAFLTDGSGNILGTYDKTFLLAFGEYLPLGEAFPVLYEWSPHSGRFTPGDHVRPIDWDGFRVTVLICYEDIIPAFARHAVTEGKPHLLVNLTNDAWFGDSNAPWQHLALAQMRAIEHRRYLVRSTNSGVSAVIDPLGRTVKESGVLTREQLHADVHLLEGSTVYQTVGDWPAWAGLTVLPAAFVSRRRRRPMREDRSSS